MGVKKLITYGRYILLVSLVIYLLLVWMYFKDNALNLTSTGLLIWFIIIPLMLILSIIVIKWSQNRSDKKSVEQLNTQNTAEVTKNPNTYQLFIYSSICLPEGDSWSEVVGNDEDLTTLSEDLSDFDSLPVLIKPIARVNTEAALLSAYGSDSYADNADNADNADIDYEGYETYEDFGNTEFDSIDSVDNTDSIDSIDSIENTQHTESMEACLEQPDSLTSRLWALIHEQFTLSDETLSAIAQHFASITQKNTYQPNSAVHIHPEWQQHYIASTDEGSTNKGDSDDSNSSVIAPIQLTIYLCIPAPADSAFLIKSIKQQLTTYGIPKPLLIIKTIITDDSFDSTRNNISSARPDANTELHQPIDFINEHLITLSKSISPEACLLIAVDSQINEEWLESQLYADLDSDKVPTEASTLLIFCNQAAQDILDIESKVSFSLTEFSDASTDGITPTHVNSRRDYLTNLIKIKQLLLDNSFLLPPINNTVPQTAEKRRKALTDNKMITNAQLTESSIIALSDINPLNQSYDLSSFMTFIDKFKEKGALVNEHNLGHYMPSNSWLKPFTSLALLVDLSSEYQQESVIAFLITQHKRCCILWLADFSKMP